MEKEASLEKFKASLRGNLLRPGDPGYDDARKVYNGMIDRHPGLISRCVDVADVIASVRYAGETGMLTAVRGGGHNAGGLGICDDGIVIDLSRDERNPCKPEGANRPRRGRMHVGRCGPRHPRVRDGHPRRASCRRPVSGVSPWGEAWVT